MSLFPPPLKPGGTIGIVSPSRWPKPEWLAKGRALLEKEGYHVVLHPQNYFRDGQLAGSDAARADALMDMFTNSSVDAILCARGGTGAMRLLDRLDYKKIRRHPKPFVGFSDITLLLQAIHKRCGFVTYHGPLLWNFAHKHDPRTVSNLFQLLGRPTQRPIIKIPKVECLRPGRADGILMGGNISLLRNLIGTPYDWSGAGKVLFLEDTDEVLYKIDQMMQHFRLAGKFRGVKAVLVGEMINLYDGETGFAQKGENRYGRSLRQILLENLPPDVPLCFNFPCGHGKYLTTLPLGAKAHVTIGAQGVELKFRKESGI